MNRKVRIPKLPRVNWKLLIMVFAIIMLVTAAVKYVPKFISGGDQKVSYVVLEKEQVPIKIQDILPRYKMLERALAAKVDDEVYVIVTRGEKLTAGYDVSIDKILLKEENNESKLVVYAVFKDPKPDEIVAQVITYPYQVVKTDLKELPKKIDLQVIEK